MLQGEAFALTCPLITKADGGKFGKTEKGNVWLDSEKTTPYSFYQFWLNCSDEDAKKFIKIFTLLDQTTIDDLISRHEQAPEQRLLQRTLAKDLTSRVHSPQNYEMAEEASQILFGNATTDSLKRLDEATFLSVFDGVPVIDFLLTDLQAGINIVDLLANGVLASKGEARRALKENSISVNKEKVKEDFVATTENLINGKYILIQRGKKTYFIIKMS
jgi:tyrosyl-tRNA synthetase